MTERLKVAGLMALWTPTDRLQRHSFGENPIAQVRTQTVLAEHVNFAAEQVAQCLPESDEIEQASPRFHLDQEIEIARTRRVSSSHRSEYAHVARPVACRTARDLIAPESQWVKVDGGHPPSFRKLQPLPGSTTRRDRSIGVADPPTHSRTELENNARWTDQLPIGRIVLRFNSNRLHVKHRTV